MRCVVKSGFNVWRAAGLMLLLSACAAEQPASHTDGVLNADSPPTVTVRDPDAVRDAREATEQAVQRISGLASVAVSAVRELGQEAARSVTGGREDEAGDAAEVDTFEHTDEHAPDPTQ